MLHFFVYILYSSIIDQYYIGHTSDLNGRIFRHINSGSKATKKANDWQLIYKEMYSTRSEAYWREMEIKKKKSKKYIEGLIVSSGLERPT